MSQNIEAINNTKQRQNAQNGKSKPMQFIDWALVLIIFSVTALFGNWVGIGATPQEAFEGMAILVGVSLLGYFLSQAIPLSFPSIAYISIIGVLISIDQFPYSAYVVEKTSKINLLSLTTPILAYAGVSIGRSWADFKKLGWRTLIVATLVLTGTFLGSALIAEIVLRMQGII